MSCLAARRYQCSSQYVTVSLSSSFHTVVSFDCRPFSGTRDAEEFPDSGHQIVCESIHVMFFSSDDDRAVTDAKVPCQI